jgi:trans-2,3-dihydro-3-hydroxyanthranilate isomerase
MGTYKYVVCDVFTSTPLTGNQLAVFTSTDAMSPATMQALAREMSFSETTFVGRPQAGGHAKVRIFTPRRELPFAGHPTLGTAVVLGEPMQLSEIRLETGAGIVPVTLERDGPRVVFGWMKQPLPVPLAFDGETALLAALGVRASTLPVLAYSNGVEHVFVSVPSEEDVATVAPDFARLATVFSGGIVVFAASGKQVRARVFVPGAGILEDAATGSAAGPLAWHLARHGSIEFGDHITIQQGREMNRPSTLYARVLGTAEAATSVEVGGGVVVVARGEFRLPLG